MRRPALALLATGVVLAGCGGPTDDQQVRQAITAFGQATKAKDYKRMCTQLLAPALVTQVQSIGLPCEQALQRGLGSVRDPQLVVGKVTVNGTRATAQVRSSAAGEAPSSDLVRLQKIRGTWRIASLAS
jgi:hypothetical protein